MRSWERSASGSLTGVGVGLSRHADTRERPACRPLPASHRPHHPAVVVPHVDQGARRADYRGRRRRGRGLWRPRGAGLAHQTRGLGHRDWLGLASAGHHRPHVDGLRRPAAGRQGGRQGHGARHQGRRPRGPRRQGGRSPLRARPDRPEERHRERPGARHGRAAPARRPREPSSPSSKAQYEREKRLAQTGSVAQSTVDDSALRVDSLEAQVKASDADTAASQAEVAALSVDARELSRRRADRRRRPSPSRARWATWWPGDRRSSSSPTSGRCSSRRTSPKGAWAS